MHRLIDPEVMRRCEAAYFRASGVASIDVMEVAARALADAALKRFPEARRVFIACGPGGNGGDGYACARMLRDAGLDVRVYPAAPAKSADAIANAARVRELICDAGAEENRTSVDSVADRDSRIPNDMPSGIRTLSIAKVQPADAEANRAQFGAESSSAAEVPLAQACERTSATPAANGGVRIPSDASGMLHPSGADAQSADAEANRAQFGAESSSAAEAPLAHACERSSANSTANNSVRIPNDASGMLLPSGADVQPADVGANRAQFSAESSSTVEAPLAQACERSSANSTANNGVRIPNDASGMLLPSDADAQPANVEANRAQFSAESSSAAEAPLVQACERSFANSTANDSIRIPEDTLAKIQPSGVDAQPVDTGMPLTHACKRSSTNSTTNDGIRIPNSTLAKIHPSTADAQPAASTANNGVRIPNSTSEMLHPSGADAQSSDAEAKQAQFGAESSSTVEAPLAQACKQTSATPAANGGVRIPNSTPAKIQPSGAVARPVNACMPPADANSARTPDAAGICLGGGHVAPGGPVDPIEIPDLWIDCLYGTGLSRAPSGVAAELIARMNRDRAAGAKVLAADIPSGLNGATGARFEPCVEADCTVAFQFAKPGHLLGDGLDVCGELRVADVGFPNAAFPANLPAQIEPSDLRGMFAPQRRNIHKGSCGHLLIVAGSFGMAGAAALCARAALRSGVGLVSIACPASIVPILQGLAPCAMCVPLPERDGAISPEAVEPMRAALRGKSAAVIGPGLSRKAAPKIVKAVLESGLPAVIDADALNLLAENPSLKSLLRPHHILTPHPGEAARLLGHRCADLIADARELSTLGTQGEIASERSTSQVRAESEAANSCAKASPCAQAAPADRCTKIATSADVPDVLPPLPGEAARMLGHRCADPTADARELAALGTQGEIASERSTSQVRAESEAANSCAKASPRAQAAPADGCTKIATSADVPAVLAPRPGEAARMSDCVCTDPTADVKALGALDTPSAQLEAMVKRAAIPASTQGEAADNRGEGMASRSCPNPIADPQALVVPGATSAREEAEGECATDQSCAQSEAVNHRAEAAASRCYSDPIADAQAPAAPGAANAQGKAASGCAKTLACMQEKPLEALNRHAEIPAEAPSEARGERAEALTSVQGEALGACAGILAEARDKCAETLTGAQDEVPGACVVIPVEARGRRTEALASAQGEAPGTCVEIPVEARGGRSEALTSAQGEALGVCAEIPAESRGEHAEALEHVQGEAPGACAEIPAEARGKCAEALERTQGEAQGGCLEIPAEARGKRAEALTSAQGEALGGCSDIPAEARGKRTETLECAQGKAPGACAEIPAEARGKRTEALEHAQGEVPNACAGIPPEVRGRCSETLTSAQGEAPGACAEIPAEARGKRAEALTSAQGEAPGGCVEIPAEAQGKCAETLERAQGEAPDDCVEIPAEARGKRTEALTSAQGKRAEALTSAQGEALGGCSEILADARTNPTGAREEIRTGVPAPSGPTAVLKGASRVIAGGGEVYVSVSGCPGMARGGSGDVYAGILGALLAERSERTPAQSAAAACELHGLAGELAQAKYGPRAMNSADLIEFLPEVFRRYVD